MEKKCNSCLKTKPIGNFYADKTKIANNGFDYACKECRDNKMECKCGRIINGSKLKRHLNSNIHSKWLNKNNQLIEITVS